MTWTSIWRWKAQDGIFQHLFQRQCNRFVRSGFSYLKKKWFSAKWMEMDPNEFGKIDWKERQFWLWEKNTITRWRGHKFLKAWSIQIQRLILTFTHSSWPPKGGGDWSQNWNPWLICRFSFKRLYLSFRQQGVEAAFTKEWLSFLIS